MGWEGLRWVSPSFPLRVSSRRVDLGTLTSRSFLAFCPFSISRVPTLVDAVQRPGGVGLLICTLNETPTLLADRIRATVRSPLSLPLLLTHSPSALSPHSSSTTPASSAVTLQVEKPSTSSDDSPPLQPPRPQARLTTTKLLSHPGLAPPPSTTTTIRISLLPPPLLLRRRLSVGTT